MQRVFNGGVEFIDLIPGASIRVTAMGGGSYANITLASKEGNVSFAGSSTEKTGSASAGPFPGIATVQIETKGRVVGFIQQPERVRTLTKVRALEQSIFTQLMTGEYVGTTRLPEIVGLYGSKLFLASGSLSALVPTGQTNTVAANLKTSTGATITNGLMTGAWALPDGNVLFSVTSNAGTTASKGYLYLAKRAAGAITATTLTVGNNAGIDNMNAVLDIGAKGGVHPTNIRILHSRSVCVATIKGAPVVFLTEYNVNFGRTTGGENDQVRVWRSNDNGLTWTVFLEFNTDGSTDQVRHGHGVVQDPATGYVYFLFGDDPKSGIVRWDGAAATPPANTPLPNFNRYPGWQSLARYDSLTDLYRTGDIVFSGDSGGYLTDRSNSGTFWNSTAITRYGSMAAVRGEKADLSAIRDPLIGLALPGGGAVWMSMWDTNLAGATRGFDVWMAPPGLGSWTLIGYLPDPGKSGTGGVLANLFLAENQVVVSLASGASRLVDSPNSYGGTLVFSLDEYFDGIPKALA